MSSTESGGIGACVRVGARTDTGVVRNQNEDAFLVADLSEPRAYFEDFAADFEVGPAGLVLMVADGMGGAAAGEVASRMAVELVFEEMVAEEEGAPRPDLDRFAELARQALERVNDRIHRQAGRNADQMGMGTTATMVALLPHGFVLSQVGDSRAYRVRNGEATQLSRDQTFLQQMLDSGHITQEQAARSGRRNLILQALGAEASVDVEQSRFGVEPGDTLLLCSDGLSELVEETEIASHVTDATAPDAAARDLIALANARGSHDNVTAVVATFGGRPGTGADGSGV